MKGAAAARRLQEAKRPVEEACLVQAPLHVEASWRANFAWALSGNVVYAACQWGMVVALARLGSSFMVGQFSLGLAIATPIFMFANLQLRAVQGTDTQRQYSFREYLGLRTVTILIALVVVASVVGLGRYERETAIVILAVAAIKAIESFSDIFYGLFLQNNHLDRTGKSMMCRGVISVIVLSAGLYFLRNLVEAILLLAVAWTVVLLGFDAAHGRRFAGSEQTGAASKLHRSWRQIRPKFSFHRQWDLVRVALPLGIVMTLVSLNLSIPRFFIHASLGEHQLGIFSALAYTTVAVATFADALGHSTIPRLSRLYTSGYLTQFRSSLLKLVASGALVSLVGVAMTQVFGAELLRILFTAEYSAHASVFVWLMAAAGISCVASLLNYGITSARRFAIQVPMFVLVVGSNTLACAWLIPSSGLLGAALAMVIASLVHLAATSGILLHMLSSRQKSATGREGAEICMEDWEPGL